MLPGVGVQSLLGLGPFCFSEYENVQNTERNTLVTHFVVQLLVVLFPGVEVIFGEVFTVT